MKKAITTIAARATIGMDLGDKHHHFCVLNSDGEIVEEGRIAATSEGVSRLFERQGRVRVALEAGTHSPWISRLLETMGHEVLIGNPRKLRMIYASMTKTDVRDAEMLARIARFDPQLLSPIQHRGQRAQAHLAVIKSRDQLVSARTALINHARGMVKSVGERLPSCSAPAFHSKAKEHVPEDLQPALGPIFQTIQDLTARIKGMDKQIGSLCSEEYPETDKLRAIHGVGPITSLAFVLTLEDATRFRKSRDVPVYLGLVPRKDQSGDVDKQLRITKAGDVLLRRLLVSSAHYILGPFGQDCDLRRWGQSLCGRGGKNAKRRAVVATARKLSVVLHALWKNDATYHPFYDPVKGKGKSKPSAEAAA